MDRRRPGQPGRRRLGAAALVLVVLGAAACSSPGGGGPGRDGPATGAVVAIGAENQYADVIGQIGGRYVHVSSILDNPTVDPHAFESSPSVAHLVGTASLIVQNGLGYDDFMGRIESASPHPGRIVVVVQHVLGLPDGTPNPHLWYSPAAMTRVASVLAADLSRLLPGGATSFRANLRRFDASMAQVGEAVSAFRSLHGGVAVATSEPVADELLSAMGADNRTPFRFQRAVMNGVDPSPQDIALVSGLLSGHRVKVFCYNRQVVDALTAAMRRQALAGGVPVVAVYETMPTPGYDYQRWMLAEIGAIDRAVADGRSTERL